MNIKEEINNVRSLLIKEYIKGQLGGNHASIDEILWAYTDRIIQSKNKEFEEKIRSLCFLANDDRTSFTEDFYEGKSAMYQQVIHWQQSLLQELNK